MKRKHAHVKILSAKLKVIKIVVSAVISVLIAIEFYNLIIVVFWMPRIIYLGLAIVVAAIVYLVLLIVAKVDEVKMLLEIILRKNRSIH